jgi:thioredoxin reductase (NADPH)
MTEENTSRHVKVLIIGSGPAGLAAALYTARANLAPVVLTGMDLGGQVSKTHAVENYPGFPDGISGEGLVQAFNEQAIRFGTEIIYDIATDVDFSEHPYKVTTYGEQFTADSIIISTGAAAITLGIPGEDEMVGRGVSYCATCDGHFFKDMDVVVVGGGDSALEEALYLTHHATSVTIVHRREELRAGEILKQRAQENPKIKFIWNTVLTEVTTGEKVESVKTKNVKTGEEGEIKTDGLFIFIGHTPNTELFAGKLAVDDRGYLKVDHLMQTEVEGVYAGGEVADPHFRQVITSAGMGAAAAIQAIRYLEEKGF